MRIILSLAMSLDGYIDDSSESRLRLSSAEDFYDVHCLRSRCDAILVGANTVRRDNPSLLTRHAELLEYRRERGLLDDPVKVTVSGSGDLPIGSKFFQGGSGEKWVFCSALAGGGGERGVAGAGESGVAAAGESGGGGESVGAGDNFPSSVRFFEVPDSGLVGVFAMLDDLGIGTLLVEGGVNILRQCLEFGLCNEFRLAIAPIFVGDDLAPRFDGFALGFRLGLRCVRSLGDTVVMDYDFGVV